MFLSTTNRIHLEILMIPSVEMCMIDLKIYKCLDDILLCCLHFKVLICQVSPNQSAKSRLGGFGLPGLAFCFRK